MIVPAALAVASLISIFPDRPLPAWPLDGGPLALAAGDLNGDGHPDVVTAEETGPGTYRLLARFQRAGSPGPPVTLARLGYPSVIALADVDGDGRTDVLGSTIYDRRILLVRQTDSGGFAPPESLDAPRLVLGLAVGRLNTDAYRDIAVIGIDSVVVHPGRAGGSFGEARGLSYGNNDAAAVGDIDDDGRLEILSGESARSRVRIWRFDGDGEFRSSAAFTATGRSSAIAFADLNGDGYREVIRQVGGTLVVHPNFFGDIEAGMTPILDRGSYLTSGDFDRDGGADLVVGAPGGVTIHRSDRSVTLQPGVTWGDPDIDGVSGVVTDWNSDGSPDVLVADRTERRLVLLSSRGDGRLDAPRLLELLASPSSMVADDWSGYGLPDVAATGGNMPVEILESTGSTLRVVDRLDVNGGVLASADFDGDRRPDLLIGELTGAIRAYSAADGYPMMPIGSLSSPVPVSALGAGDLNGDGIVDLAVTSSGLSGIRLLMLNAARQPHRVELIGTPEPLFAPPLLVDVDGDADLDVVALTAVGRRIRIFRNDGAGHFGPGETLAGDPVIDRVVAADIDGDGYPDLATVTPALPGITLWWGEGGRVPRTKAELVVEGPVEGLAIADLTGDGRPDLVFGDRTGEVLTVLPAAAERAFDEPRESPGVPGRLTIIPIDWSLDSRIDLVIASSAWSNPDLMLLENTGGARVPTLIEASAVREPGRATIRWRTRPFAVGHRWDVLRGPAGRPLMVINLWPIGGVIEYAFHDTLVPDEPAEYWLQEFSRGSHPELHGPFAIGPLPETLLDFRAVPRLDSLDVSWNVNEYGVPLGYRLFFDAGEESRVDVTGREFTGRDHWRVRVASPSTPGGWWLEQRSFGGGRRWLGPFATTSNPGRPLVAGPAYPNPSRSSVTIPFFLETPGPLRLRIFGADGRLISTPVDRPAEGGFQTLDWDGRRSDGLPAAAGIYFLEVEAAGRRVTLRVVRAP